MADLDFGLDLDEMPNAPVKPGNVKTDGVVDSGAVGR